MAPKASLTTMPQEIIGLIVDDVLPTLPTKDNGQYHSCTPPKPIGHEGLMEINSVFELEVWTAVKKANGWVRNICFDEGNDGNADLMNKINTWIDPCTSDVVGMILDSFSLPKKDVSKAPTDLAKVPSDLVEGFVRLALDIRLNDTHSYENTRIAVGCFIGVAFEPLRHLWKGTLDDVDRMIYRRLSKRLEKVGLWPEGATLEKYEKLCSREWKHKKMDLTSEFEDMFENHRATRRDVRPWQTPVMVSLMDPDDVMPQCILADKTLAD